MTEISAMTIELIEKRPLTAVKVLTAMSTSDSAAFFEVLPTRYAVSLMSNISAWSASTLIAEMAPVSGAAVLSELDYQLTASIMRVLPDAKRAGLLRALPKTLSSALTSTLTYPKDTVGAKMSTNIVIMTIDQSVGEAFAELRQIKRTKTGVAYIVDEARKLLGIVTADELLRLSNEIRLGDVMEKSVAPLSARARLSAVKSLPAWDDYAHLPVIDRKRILIGALARRTFRQPAIEQPSDLTQNQAPPFLPSVAGAFLNSSVGLAQVLIGISTTSETPTNPSSPSAIGKRS